MALVFHVNHNLLNDFSTINRHFLEGVMKKAKESGMLSVFVYNTLHTLETVSSIDETMKHMLKSSVKHR